MRYQVNDKSKGGELGGPDAVAGADDRLLHRHELHGDVVFFGKADLRGTAGEFQQASKPPPDPAASAVTPLDPALSAAAIGATVVILGTGNASRT
ncbi:hypothetical protein GCM10020220_069820 [Nonomuraea rubra]|uniref:hypothetical protein n=1 Tax=Nonomuraea rubra TaxID=46180 RepID=UPI0031F0F99E